MSDATSNLHLRLRDIRRTAQLVAILSLAFSAASCGGGSEDSSGTSPPTSGTGPQPIVAPARTWTFVPIEGARCANGSATGIGVRLVPGSRQLYIYMEGGGACTTGDNCWGNGPGGAANVNGYGATEFARESKLTSFAFLDTSTGTRNPFVDMNMVMIPYCTGDGHSGNAVRALTVGTGTRDTHFVGANNMRLALERLAATFPTLDQVWLMGTSAGGAGATFNYSAVRAALRTQVHSIIDSAPGFFDPSDPAKWSIWGTQAPCAGCASVADIRRFNRSLDPASRYAFLSFRFDPVTAQPGWTEQRYGAEMNALIAELQADINARTFIVDNSATGFGPPSYHVVTTNNTPGLRNAYLDFVSAMVSGTQWNNRLLPIP